MYTMKEIELSNKKMTKKRLIIEFTDPKMRIVGEFLMVDAPLLQGEVLRVFEDVLQGKEEEASISGNRTSATIRQKKTLIRDLFADETVTRYPSYEMETAKLYELTNMWLERIKELDHS